MKIKYYEWKCVGCGKTSRFNGKHVLSAMPYWFTLRTEGCASSSEHPSFNVSVCSIHCLSKVSEIIDAFIKRRKPRIAQKKDIEATICEQCGEVVKIDTLNMIYGPGPLKDWTWEETPEGRKDFCSTKCKKDHSAHPEKSVFADFEFDESWKTSRLIEIINSSDMKEAIKLLNEKSKRNPFKLPVT